MKRLLVPAMMVLALVSASANANAAVVAQPEDADSAARKDDGAEGKAAVYDFDDDSVQGELLRPEGANIASRGRAKHASLITIRAHFIGEMIRLALDI